MVTINMTIPDTCSDCPLSVRHFGKLYCPPLNDRVGNEGKDSRCPLVDAEGRGDLISREDALNCFHDWVDQRGDVHTADEMPEYQRIEQLPTAHPDVPDINVGDLNKFIDGLVEIFADIRESHVDDSVCGLCEFDGAYIGESGDWCNECPGFNRDDCFKLRDGIRKKWITEITACMPSAQPERPEQPESAREYCAECDHIEMCRWYPYEGCEFRSLPSAQPKTGKWTKISPTLIYECSECGQHVLTADIDAYKFCHGCGCRMLKEGD